MTQHGKSHRDSVVLGRLGKGLSHDDRAHKNQKWRNRRRGDEFVEEGVQAGDRHQKENNTHCRRISQSRAKLLVSWVTDINSGRECAPEESPYHSPCPVGYLADPHRILVTGGLGRLHVVHGFDEIVDLDWQDHGKDRGPGHQ